MAPPPGAGARACLPATLELPLALAKLSLFGHLPGDTFFSPLDFGERSVWEAAKRAQVYRELSPELLRALVRAYWVIGGSAHQEIQINLWPKIFQVFEKMDLLIDREGLDEACLEAETGHLAIDACHAELVGRIAAQR